MKKTRVWWQVACEEGWVAAGCLAVAGLLVALLAWAIPAHGQSAVPEDSPLEAWWEPLGTNQVVLKVRGHATAPIQWRVRGFAMDQLNATNPPSGGSSGETNAPDNTLVLNYRFNEVTGTNLTDQTSTYPGTVTASGLTWNSGWLDFDGSAGAGSSSGSVTYGTNIVSISFWVKIDSTSSTRMIVESSATVPGTPDTFDVLIDAGNMEAGMKGATGFRIERLSVSASTNWQHFVCVIDGSTATGDVKIYRDGVEQVTTIPYNDKTGTNNFSAQTLYIGARNRSSLFYDGGLDDIRIYKGELTSSEVAYLYNAGREIGSVPDNTLLLALRFPEGSGTTTTNDGSGQTILATFPSWVTGKSGSGYSLRFNGSSDRLTSTNNITYGTNIITISLWMQLTNATASDKVLLESSPNYFSNADSWLILADDSTDTNKMVVVNRGTTTGRRQESFTRPTDNGWHHLVVTLDASTESGETKVWLDTVEQSTTIAVNTKTGTSNFSAQYLYGAARNAGSLHLNCTLDDVRIYGGELSSDEILYLYNNPQ